MPVEERYIQSFINMPDGGTLIFTCVPALLNLIQEVTSFECDVTFKRVQTLNEWELVIYYPPIERGEQTVTLIKLSSKVHSLNGWPSNHDCPGVYQQGQH